MSSESETVVVPQTASLEPVAMPALVGLLTGIITAIIFGKYPGITSWIGSGYMVDVFTLQAGASANWGTEKLPNSSGKGNTGFAKGNEGKNQKLAFDRGDKFMTEVNKGLKAGGHPGFDNYEVNWVVEGQNDSDQFIDLMLSVDKEDKIETRIIGTSIKGDTKEGAGKGALWILTHKLAYK